MFRTTYELLRVSANSLKYIFLTILLVSLLLTSSNFVYGLPILESCIYHDSRINLDPAKERFEQGERITINVNSLHNDILEIIAKNPKNIEVFSDIIKTDSSGKTTIDIPLSDNAMRGTWTIFVKSQSNEAQNVVFVGVGTTAKTNLVIDAYQLNYPYDKNAKALFFIAGDPNQSASIDVVDSSGNNVFKNRVISIPGKGNCEFSLDLGGFDIGVYTISISDANRESSSVFSIGLKPSGHLTNFESDDFCIERCAGNSEGIFSEIIPMPQQISPLKQFKSGIAADEIQCKDNLVLIQKYDGSPACVKPESINILIHRGWADEKFRTPPIFDLQSPERISREIGYLGLMMMLPHIEEHDTIAVSLEGRSNLVSQMVDLYGISTLSSKVSSDESLSMVFGNITKTNLQRFFEDETMNNFAKRGILFTSLGGYSNDSGTFGPFNQFLDENDEEQIGKILEYYENKRTDMEEVHWDDFVEWPTGKIKDEYLRIIDLYEISTICESHSGFWNKDFAACFDFSDEFDCLGLGGFFEDKAYTSGKPNYTKISDSYVCMFKK